MSTSDGERQPWEHEGLTGERMEPVNIARGQTSSSPSPLQVQAPPFQPAVSSFLEILAALSHEFHTPLTVIEGYTSTLLSQRQRLASEEQDEFLQMIQQAGRRLEKLTERLLEITQLEAGIIRLDHSLVDISTLAREAMIQAEHQVPEPLRSRFTFALQCRDALGNPIQELPLVKGDVQRLHQILEHLLGNAICYSPTGGRIDVIARPAPQAGSLMIQEQTCDTPPYLEICVCDVGIGISDEHLERIFDPFYRVDTRLTRQSNSLGLGLTVCKHLVTLHQGRIWAESCPDGGSAFHVWLPFDGSISAF